MSYVWNPTKTLVEKSNVKKFMDRHGIKDYKALIKRSTEDIEWFWETAIKELNVEWFREFKKVLDQSKGVQWTKWFIEGKINITHNCVDRHTKTWRKNKLALIWSGENGEEKRYSFQDLYYEVNRFANALRNFGVKKGSTVGLTFLCYLRLRFRYSQS